MWQCTLNQGPVKFLIENENNLINRLKDRLAMLPDLCPDLTRTDNPITPIDGTRESLLEKSSRNVTESKEYAMPDDLKADFEFFQEEFRNCRGWIQWLNSNLLFCKLGKVQHDANFQRCDWSNLPGGFSKSPFDKSASWVLASFWKLFLGFYKIQHPIYTFIANRRRIKGFKRIYISSIMLLCEIT